MQDSRLEGWDLFFFLIDLPEFRIRGSFVLVLPPISHIILFAYWLCARGGRLMYLGSCHGL